MSDHEIADITKLRPRLILNPGYRGQGDIICSECKTTPTRAGFGNGTLHWVGAGHFDDRELG